MEVDDTLKTQMNSFLLSTASQQEIATLDNKVGASAPGSSGATSAVSQLLGCLLIFGIHSKCSDTHYMPGTPWCWLEPDTRIRILPIPFNSFKSHFLVCEIKTIILIFRRLLSRIKRDDVCKDTTLYLAHNNKQ